MNKFPHKEKQRQNLQPKATLYYDSDCPICSTEMNKLARLKNEGLTLQPINQLHNKDIRNEDKNTLIGKNIDAFYDELHVRTADGSWLTGYDANIYAWQQTKYAPIAKWFAIPPLAWCGKLGYKIWLIWYQWQRKKRVAMQQNKEKSKV